MTWVSGCSGWPQFETQQKGEILLDLINSLIKEKKCKPEHVFINYSYDFYETNELARHTRMSYGEDSYTITNGHTASKKYSAKGIVFNILDFDLDILKILKLVNHSLDSITASRTHQLIDDTLSLNKVLQERHFRNKTQIKRFWKVDYYFQNGKFNFYYLESQENNAPPKARDLFVSNNVLEIVGNYDLGYLVFLNDSIFRYVELSIHPYYEDPKIYLFNWRKGTDNHTFYNRFPIDNIYQEYWAKHSQAHIFLNFNFFNGKALFIPRFNLVSTEYGKMENEIIDGLVQKATQKNSVILPKDAFKAKDKSTSGWIFCLILGGLLLVSVVINVILARYKR